MAIFNAQSEVMTEIYGEYYLGELMETQNEQNR